MTDVEASAAFRPRPFEVAACVVVGSIAILIFGVQPLLYTAYVGEQLVAPHHLGLLSATEVIAIAAGSALAIPALRRWRTGSVALFGVLLLCAANLFQARTGTADLLFFSRAAAGFGSGFLVGIAGAAIAATRRVGQWTAAFLLGQALSQFLLVEGFASYEPEPLSAHLQFALALLAFTTIVGIPLLPRRLTSAAADGQPSETTSGGGRPDGAGFIWLVIMFFFVGGAITVWAYAGVWLQTEGVAAGALTSLLSICLAGQVVGAFVASMTRSGRYDWMRLIATTGLLLVSVAAWLAWPHSWIAAAGFGIWWMSSVPILSSILSHVDPDRKALPFAPAAQLAGVAIIPTVAGIAFAESNLAHVLIAGCAAVGAGLLLGFARPPRSAAPDEEALSRAPGGQLEPS